MKLNNHLLGIAPKPFQTINIHFPRKKPPLMVHSQMPIATKHQRIITLKLICIHNGSSSHLLYGHIQQRLRRHTLHDLYSHRPISLVNTENRDFPSCPSSSLPFPSSSKVGFIQFNFSFKKSFLSLAGQKSHAKDRDRFQNGWITEPDLLRNLPRREFDFKEFDNTEPFLVSNTKLINPSIRKIMEGVFAPLTPVPFTDDAIDF